MKHNLIKTPATLVPAAIALAGGVLAAGLLFAGPSSASGSGEEEHCATQGEWQSMDALRQKLQDEGWQRIEEMEVDDGCYEVEGIDAQGQKVELYVDPVTFDAVRDD